MRVGFLGIQCDNPNLGVAALGYSAIRIIADLVPTASEFIIFSTDSIGGLEKVRQTLELGDTRLTAMSIRHRNPSSLLRALRTMRTCDAIIDLTGGDSFSDIYGSRRLVVKLFDKQMVLLSGTPLVLAPQTIGPFIDRKLLPWVTHVLRSAALVFTRDEPSGLLATELAKREVTVATDIAVRLPWQRLPVPSPRVAFNVSGLLWNGGYTGSNQFGLRADYRDYCQQTVQGLLAAGHEVHLLAHVTARGEDRREDDLMACGEMLRQFPQCRLAPQFDSPVAAKSFIAGMDVVIGSRMHATIAALSTGVAVVPASYSRKFQGFYSNLGYHDVIDLLTLDAATAATATLDLVADRDRLRDCARSSNAKAQVAIESFIAPLGAMLAPVPLSQTR